MTLTKKDRFIAAIRGDVPDMVPVAPLIHCRMANEVFGKADLKSVFDVHQMIGSIHHRGPIGIELNYDLPDGYGEETRDVPSPFEGKMSESLFHTPRRTLCQKHARGMIPHDPLVGKTVEYAVKDKDDWLALLDFRQASLESITGSNTQGCIDAFEMMGEEGSPSVGLWPSYTSLASACGMEQFMVDIFDYPDLLDEIFAIDRQIMDAQIDAFLQTPNEVGFLDICWATGSQLGPELFRRWALPDVVRVMEKVRNVPNKYVGLYTLGPIAELLPMLVDAGVAFVETFEPNGGNITMAEGKKLYGDKICIMGNFDCNVLAFGSLEDARTEARRCLKEGMDGGRYVMVTADEVPADTQMDNLKAMVEIAEQHGQY